jgi:hypothetical protein
MNNNKSFHRHLLAIALGSTLTMTGCGGETTTTTAPTSPEASPANTASPVAGTPATSNNPIQKATQIAAGQYAGLAKVVMDTTTAVTAGDFVKATTEFAKFEGEWQKVEDAIKVKSPTSYETIENSMDQVNAALKGSQPAKDQLLASLQTLTQTISTLGK